MPQDSLKSVVKYRSFVRCDDPKGVVECKTIRKSKTGCQVEDERMPKNLNLNRSSSSKREKDEMVSKGTQEGLHDPSSFQLMEVSRGAQKLNQVIDSWSKGMSFDGGSKDIARDLLKGALGLQESLIMLGKLQEASNYMAKLKKKQKEKSGGGRGDDTGIERTDLNQFGNHNYQMGSQNPRVSTDGSSRDCYDELREVIRDSLARQNLLPNRSSQEKAYYGRRKLDLSPDMPSTSSSRSSMGYSHDFGSSDCSFSSKVQEEKPKGSNLIAKLMGLEDIPSKQSQSASQKQLERDKILNERRPIFDIDMPKARKSQFVVQKLDRERVTLEEIIETMQFKGVLNSNEHQTYHYNTSHLEKRLTEDAPPIVIMKPLQPGLEPEEEIPRNWKTKEEVPSAIMDHRGGYLNSNEMRRKLQAEESQIKKLRQEKGTERKKVVVKPEDKEVKIKENMVSNTMKASVPLRAKSQKKETIEKKVDKIQKMTPSRRKPVEMECVKSTSDSKTIEQGNKVTLAKQRKPESSSNNTRNRISEQKSTTPNSVSKHSTPVISHNSSERKKSVKNEKPVSEPLATNIGNMVCKDEDKQIDLICENESDGTVNEITPTVQLHTEEETEALEILIKEICDTNQNSLREAIPPTNQLETDIKSPEEAYNYIGYNNTTERNNLLLSSPSFLSHAEELFDINTYQPILLQSNSSHDSEPPNSRPLLDSANELLEQESLRHVLTIPPFLQKPVESLPADTVYLVLERDLRCKGGWDMGWRDGFSVDEVEQVVGGIDKLVLSELIDELLTNFVL